MFYVKLAKSFDRNCTLCLSRSSQDKEVHSNKQRQTRRKCGFSSDFFFFFSTVYYIFLVLWSLLICQLSISATGSGKVIPFVILSENISQIKICEVC